VAGLDFSGGLVINFNDQYQQFPGPQATFIGHRCVQSIRFTAMAPYGAGRGLERLELTEASRIGLRTGEHSIGIPSGFLPLARSVFLQRNVQPA
jgi:hypothetical protein